MLLSLIAGIWTGFILTQLVNWLDFAMDWGHYLGRWRSVRAMKTAKRLGHRRAKEFEGQIKLATCETQSEAMTRMDSVYWNLAIYDKGLMLWLCKFCFGTRISLVVSFLGALFLGFVIDWFDGLIYFFTTNAIFWYLLK